MEYYNTISPTKKGKLVPININNKPTTYQSFDSKNENSSVSQQDISDRSKLNKNTNQNFLIKEINNEELKMISDNKNKDINEKKDVNSDKVENKVDESKDDKILENLLLNVKILSNIKEFDKLSTSNDEMLVIDSPSYLQGIYRTFYGDSREETLNKIDNIINDLFKITDEMLDNETKKKKKYYNNFKDDNSTIFQKIAINLSESIKGLQNLKITYIKDVSITSRLDIIINKIQNRINKIVQLLQIVLE